MSGTNKRVHGIEKAGGGDVGTVEVGDVLGSCPGCGAELHVAEAQNPATGRMVRGLLHPLPFCTYYGETDPREIADAIRRMQQEN